MFFFQCLSTEVNDVVAYVQDETIYKQAQDLVNSYKLLHTKDGPIKMNIILKDNIRCGFKTETTSSSSKLRYSPLLASPQLAAASGVACAGWAATLRTPLVCQDERLSCHIKGVRTMDAI
ncbi:hypothetical protein ACJJTC_002918 [Scirpophaga incertulas]